MAISMNYMKHLSRITKQSQQVNDHEPIVQFDPTSNYEMATDNVELLAVKGHIFTNDGCEAKGANTTTHEQLSESQLNEPNAIGRKWPRLSLMTSFVESSRVEARQSGQLNSKIVKTELKPLKTYLKEDRAKRADQGSLVKLSYTESSQTLFITDRFDDQILYEIKVDNFTTDEATFNTRRMIRLLEFVSEYQRANPAVAIHISLKSALSPLQFVADNGDFVYVTTPVYVV